MKWDHFGRREPLSDRGSSASALSSLPCTPCRPRVEQAVYWFVSSGGGNRTRSQNKYENICMGSPCLGRGARRAGVHAGDGGLSGNREISVIWLLVVSMAAAPAPNGPIRLGGAAAAGCSGRNVETTQVWSCSGLDWGRAHFPPMLLADFRFCGAVMLSSCTVDGNCISLMLLWGV